MGERVLGRHRSVRSSHDRESLRAGFLGPPHQVEALKTVLGGRGHADDVGPVVSDLLFDLSPAELQNFGRDDLDIDALSLQDASDGEKSERRHG